MLAVLARASQAGLVTASPSLRAAAAALATSAAGGGGGGGVRGRDGKWRMLAEQGHDVNPCNSRLHPGHVAGEIPVDDARDELSVQEAYTPDSACFGCGPAAGPASLGLRSFRGADGGLVARTTLAPTYQAFPGIINGGIVSALFDCHGNWTAAVALMDRACLPRPPLTLTAELLVTYREPTPPGVPLTVRSSVVRIKESSTPGSGKASVQVDLTLHAEGGGPGGGGERLLATASGIFKKLGALRAL